MEKQGILHPRLDGANVTRYVFIGRERNLLYFYPPPPRGSEWADDFHVLLLEFWPSFVGFSLYIAFFS